MILSAVSVHAIAKICMKPGRIVPWLLCYGCCAMAAVLQLLCYAVLRLLCYGCCAMGAVLWVL